MKRTVTANISGKLFTLDDDAFSMLEHYIEQNKPSKAQVPNDTNAEIEQKVRELLEQRGAERIITAADIHYVISVLGPVPENNFDTHRDHGRFNSDYGYKPQRRLYRDTDNRAIGGVCSGLAAYFDIDTVLMRIIFLVLFFFGFGFLAYIILWIVVPKARTPEQKKEMWGY